MTAQLLTAADRFGSVIEAFTHQQAGKNDVDHGHYADAHRHFVRALAIRREFELPDDQIGSSQLALDAAQPLLEEQT